MAQDKPHYEVNEEFNEMAGKLADKYPEKFSGIETDSICCVNITNKERKGGRNEPIWKVKAVQMPMALHCPYTHYIVLWQSDWDTLGERHKLAVVAETLHAIPLDEKEKVTPMDLKGYHAVLATLGLDFMEDSEIPHLLEDDVEWKR